MFDYQLSILSVAKELKLLENLPRNETFKPLELPTSSPSSIQQGHELEATEFYLKELQKIGLCQTYGFSIRKTINAENLTVDLKQYQATGIGDLIIYKTGCMPINYYLAVVIEVKATINSGQSDETNEDDLRPQAFFELIG